MARRDITRILNKKTWTGRELGILEVTNMCVLYRQALEGKTPVPIVEQADLLRMLSTIKDRQQGMTYNGYIAIHEWLTVKYNIAQTQFQQAQVNFRTLEGYIERAILAEGVYRYIEQLPVIMTQKQYDEFRKKRIEEALTDESGEELYSGIFNMVELAISYYVNKLQKEPSKPNPLKAIRKKYINQPVKSDLIRSRWNEITGEGYYTIEDGSGRRSDQMTLEEWQEAITTPKMRKALQQMNATNGEGTAYTTEIATQRLLTRSKVIFSGGTEEEADNAQREQDYKDGLATPVKWHYYEEAPADLSKWDVIEQDLLLELYPADLDGSGDAWTESNFNRSMKDFTTEFAELVQVILADIDKKYSREGFKLAELPLEEWATTCYSWRDLYEMDFYGKREEIESDTTIFNGDKRALFNGIAILRASDLLGDRSLRINESGDYEEPQPINNLSNFTLEAFFTDGENYAENVDIVEDSRATLVSSYYFVKGYNLALELIGKYFDVPDITVFQLELDFLERQIQGYNELVPVLYRKIKDTNYQDGELQAKKLQVLRDMFTELDYRSIQIPEQNIEKAKALFKDFKAFKGEQSGEFSELLCMLPNDQNALDYYEGYEDEDEEADEDGEGAY